MENRYKRSLAEELAEQLTTVRLGELSLTPTRTLAERENIRTTGLLVDYRAKTIATSKYQSCLEGISFGSTQVSSQEFAIQDGEKVVGVTTIIVVPQEQIKDELYFQRIE